MGADPEPVISAVALSRHRPVAPANLHRVNAAFPLEAVRGVTRVCREKSEVFVGQLLNVLRKLPMPGCVTSRERAEITRIDLSIELLERACVPAARRKIFFQLLVPGEVVLTRDKGCQARQFLGRQGCDGLLNFRETHEESVARGPRQSKAEMKAKWQRASADPRPCPLRRRRSGGERIKEEVV